MNVIAPRPIERSNESQSDPIGSLLGSFVIAARYRGIHLTVPQLIHDHLLASDDVLVSQLIEIAQAAGLRAVAARLAWSDLLKLGKALPVIVRGYSPDRCEHFWSCQL